MSDRAVLIAGAGPTGLILAAELALAGIDVAILERRIDQNLAGARAGGLHARTLEVLDQRGVAERFLEAGRTAQVAGFAWIPLDISDFPTRHPYGLALSQIHIERLLADWVGELGVPVHRGEKVTGFAQDEHGVDVALADGRRLRAAYLVGCDGGRSLIRKTAGIGFPGWDATTSNLIAEAEMEDPPEPGLRHDERGIHSIAPTEDGKAMRIMVTEHQTGGTGEPSLADLRAALIRAYGSDFGVHSPRWLSRFTDMARQAETYRRGRLLLAGDAAHVHYPTGGQGLNIGVQDAVNLGWKLAQVVKGISPESLLDTYQAERGPIAARVLRDTMAQVALLRPVDDRARALRETLTELLSMEGPRRHFGGVMSGLGVHYDLGEGHPLLGRRMPDLELDAPGEKRRVYRYLHRARPLLLCLCGAERIDVGPWADRVQRVEARYDGPWQLPVLGPVSPPRAMLVRPDGYVAWVGCADGSGLEEALTRWFGPPAGE